MEERMFDYTSTYLRMNQKPWFPIMGEFHYSRYQDEFWEEELRKIQAGGVTIVSTYVIWIHHEEEEGVFDFSGCCDLRKFLQLCKKVGLMVFLRPGPWVHGEVRNGGFPDWLMEKGKRIRLRSDDPAYLRSVTRFWQAIFQQAQGLFWDQGGPIIGIQIENEYGHVGGLRGADGEQHMRTLTALAKKIGFCVPLYTATGWGGACTGGLLPVMGGYCEAPWAQTTGELPANSNYIFSHVRSDLLIGCDHNVNDELTFDETKFPYLTAELGGGVQITDHRRPQVSGADIGAMSIAKLGSGVGMLGYYMYHGGSNPCGKYSSLQESRETGYANDLPEINYDFQAPIRQFGTISDTYREIRLLALFLRDFGELLAPMQSKILTPCEDPENAHTLRLACRFDENGGFLFFNNYQRRRTMDAHPGTVLMGYDGKGTVLFPKTDIASGEFGFFPYRLVLGQAILQSALATPLCKLRTAKEEVFVFYGDRENAYQWESKETAAILHLNRAQALKAVKVHLDQDYLILTDYFVWADDGKLVVTGERKTEIYTYPALHELPVGFRFVKKEGALYQYIREVAEEKITWKLTSAGGGQSVKYKLHLEYPGKNMAVEYADAILRISYLAERMNVFCTGKKVNDYFYNGQDALLSLRYFGYPTELELELLPICNADQKRIYLDVWPELAQGDNASISNVSIQQLYS